MPRYTKSLPAKRKRRRKYRRRFFKKKGSNKLAVVTRGYADLRKAGQPLPRVMRNMMRYQDYVQNMGTGTNLTHIWRLNSNFDIDLTATGGQPPMRDDLYTYYFLSRVNKAYIRYNIQNGSSRAMRVSFVLQQDTADFADSATYNVQGLPGYLCSLSVGAAGGGSDNKTKVLKVDILKSLKKLVYPDSISYARDLWASSTVSPTRILYLAVYVQHLDEAAGVAYNYDYDISIMQDTTWSLQLQDPTATFD